MKNVSKLMFGLALLALVACDKKGEKPTVKSNGLQPANTSSVSGAIAFVEVDSLSTQYEFCKEQSAILEKQQQNYRNILNNKGQQLQNAMQAFQQKMQNGSFTSQQQAEQAQAALQKQQQQLQNLQEQYEEDMTRKASSYQKALRDSLNNFLSEYNQSQKYSVILAKQGDNILYADKSLNITNEVVAGLNKRYKKK